jgi:hypothetical protein
MQPQEVLQALVSSMEKTLRKEKDENPAGQVPPLKASPQKETGGKPEVKPSPERRKRESRHKEVESRCTAHSKGKGKGIPPKTRWKEEQKERIQGLRELRNGEKKVETREGNVNAKAKGKENRGEVVSGPEEATAVLMQGRDKPRPILEGIKGGVENAEGGAPKMPVACISGVSREPAHAGVVERMVPAGSNSRHRSDELHGDINVKKGDPVQSHDDTDGRRHSDGHRGGADLLWFEGYLPQPGESGWAQGGPCQADREEDRGLGA